MPDATEAAKRKPRWWLRIVIALAVIGVLAVCAEFALRAIIPSVIAGEVRENLQLSPSHTVTVDLQGSALLPALTGRVGPATVTVPDAVVFEGIEADLQVSADSIPFDPSKGLIENGVISVTVPYRSMSAIVSLATHGMVDTGEIDGGELVVGRTFSLFGLDVSVMGSLQVTVEEGDLVVVPTAVKAVGFDLSAERLRALLGDSASGVLDPHTVCVRDQLPVGITLQSLKLSSTVLGGTATATATVDPDVLSNPAKQGFGTCESEQ